MQTFLTEICLAGLKASTNGNGSSQLLKWTRHFGILSVPPSKLWLESFPLVQYTWSVFRTHLVLYDTRASKGHRALRTHLEWCALFARCFRAIPQAIGFGSRTFCRKCITDSSLTMNTNGFNTDRTKHCWEAYNFIRCTKSWQRHKTEQCLWVHVAFN